MSLEDSIIKSIVSYHNKRYYKYVCGKDVYIDSCDTLVESKLYHITVIESGSKYHYEVEYNRNTNNLKIEEIGVISKIILTNFLQDEQLDNIRNS